jgi:hypothetical protein
MEFLHIDNTTKGIELILDCATTSITMAPPLSSSTPPTTELAEMAASNVAAVAGATSNVAVVAGGTSNVAVAASATSVVTVVGGTGVAVTASVLMATVLSPAQFVINMRTPSPSPYPTVTPKVQCPDAGAAMFAGYKVSNTSEDSQLLLLVTLTDLPERLELFLTNSFTLPTMSEVFAGNNTGSVKVRRNFILVYIEREV